MSGATLWPYHGVVLSHGDADGIMRGCGGCWWWWWGGLYNHYSCNYAVLKKEEGETTDVWLQRAVCGQVLKDTPLSRVFTHVEINSAHLHLNRCNLLAQLVTESFPKLQNKIAIKECADHKI